MTTHEVIKARISKLTERQAKIVLLSILKQIPGKIEYVDMMGSLDTAEDFQEYI